MTNQKNQHEDSSGVSPVAAAITGAVVGASVGVAGAVVLNDEKNREKVKEVLSNVKNQAVSYVENMQKQAEDKKDEIGKRLAEGKDTAKKITDL